MVKKKNKMKKLAALFSVILLLTAFACLSAFAEGNEAKIGETEYATLVDALGKAVDGDTVTLLQDVNLSLSDQCSIKTNISVDGAKGDGTGTNYTITLNANTGYRNGFKIYSNVTFKNMTITATGSSTMNYGAFNLVTTGALTNLTLDNVTIKDIKGARWGAVGAEYQNNVKLTMINSKIENCSAGWKNYYGAAVSLNVGGTFTMDENSIISGCTGGKDDNGAAAVGVTQAKDTNEGNVVINGTITTTTPNAVYAGAGTTVTVGETATISNAVYMTDVSKINGGLEASCGNKFYQKFADALGAAAATDTVTLLKDAAYDGDGGTYRRGIIDGDNHTLTLNKRILVGTQGNLTLRNIKVDLSTFSDSNTAKQDAFAVYGNTLTFEDGTIITGADGNLSNVVRVAGANSAFNMKGGSIENCSVNHAVVYVHANDGSKATISGGSIKNNAVLDMRGGVYLERGTLTITGNPEILGNHKKDAATPFNVQIAGGTFNVEAPFTGKIGVRKYNGGESVAEAGDTIGNAVGNLTLSADSIVRDGSDPELIGYVSGGKVVINNKLTLTPETSMGKYTADSNTYGVVRVNTYVNGITDPSLVEEVGTYFYTATSASTEKTDKRSVTVKPAIEKVVNGNGYMADVYHIDDPNATVYAVNFYKLVGIDGYIFSALEPISYNVNAVQSVDYTEAE